MYDFLAHLWAIGIMCLIVGFGSLVIDIAKGDFPPAEPGDIVSEFVYDEYGAPYVEVAVEVDGELTTETRKVILCQGGHCSNWCYYPLAN